RCATHATSVSQRARLRLPELLLQQITEGAELRLALHAGAVLLIRLLLGVLFERADRELRFAAAGIDVDDLRFELGADRELFPEIGAARRAGVARRNERARAASGDAEDAHHETAFGLLRDHDLYALVRRDLLARLVG